MQDKAVAEPEAEDIGGRVQVPVKRELPFLMRRPSRRGLLGHVLVWCLSLRCWARVASFRLCAGGSCLGSVQASISSAQTFPVWVPVQLISYFSQASL
jgi:hypothetical protein